jgi:hypothetical protein
MRGGFPMKKINKILCTLLVLSMLITLFPTTAEAATKPKLNKTKTTIFVGQTTRLKVTNSSSSVTWKSSSKKIATVSKSGTVTGKKVGTCTITATIGKKSVKCKVIVRNQFPNTVTLTNKIVGDYNDKDQEIKYAILASKYGTIRISGVEYEVEDIILCGCRQFFLGNDYYRVHDEATNYEHNVSTSSNKLYVFTLKNNQTATIEVSSDRTITIYRMCHSDDNQTVTYSTDNGKTTSSMPKNNMDSSTGMSSSTGIKISSATSMIVYNTYLQKN